MSEFHLLAEEIYLKYLKFLKEKHPDKYQEYLDGTNDFRDQVISYPLRANSRKCSAFTTNMLAAGIVI